MAFFYVDTDAGSDASAGTSWATAKLTMEGAFTVMSAGDTCFFQGAAADTTAANRTLTSPGTSINPCKVTGVADGTTNEGASIVVGDLASTLPVISVTGAASDIAFAGVVSYINTEINISDRPTLNTDAKLTLINSKLTHADRFTLFAGSVFTLINTELNGSAGTADIQAVTDARMMMYGGSITGTARSLFRVNSDGDALFQGVDMSALGSSNFFSSTSMAIQVKIINCKLNSVFNTWASAPTEGTASIEVINSSSTTSVGNTSSIQDYEKEDSWGTVLLETTAVRTGGADDGAAGAFAYGLTPHANAVLPGTFANVASPWMSVWVASGSKTLTNYIANDGAGDYNEDEAWVEFYTPDASDTAQHDQNFDPADERLLESSTAITDDTGSTWGTGGSNHQKFSTTVNPGFEGFAYSRLHVAKRQGTPDTVYLDPKIEVT